MINILKSSLGKSDPYYVDYLTLLLEEASNYKKNYKIDNILSKTETKVIKFIIKSFEVSGETPSIHLFEQAFEEDGLQKGVLESGVEIDINDFRVYIFNFIDNRVNKYISGRLEELNEIVRKQGISDEIAQEFTKLTALSNRNKAKDIEIEIQSKQDYENKKLRPVGLKTGIKEIDDKIGGMSTGTVTTIAGFTSHMKCVSENERVYTNQGLLTMKEIYNIGINEGLEVQSEYGMRKLVVVHDEGEKDSYIISIAGIPIETSPVHRFRVLTEKGLGWKEAQHLEVGDKVVQSLKKSTHEGNKGNVDYWRLYGQLLVHGQKEFTEEIYKESEVCWEHFIKGVFATNGCKSGNNIFIYSTNEKTLLGISKLLSVMGVSVAIDGGQVYVCGKRSLNRLKEIVGNEAYSFVTKYHVIQGTSGNKEYTITKDRKFTVESEEITEAELTWNKVTKIEKSRCYMYDLTVDGSPTYCINGYVTHNTTMALNIARLNAYYLGYNIAYLSLETPKEDMNWNLLSCHSYETKFNKYNFISHDKMRRCRMTEDEEDYVFNVVEPDLKGDYKDDEGNIHHRGKIVILDESDFKTFSFGEISAVLEKVDDKLGGKLDAVIVDYIQLCKFSGEGITYDANSQINSYVTFFRRLGQNFKKEILEDGTEKVRQLTMILLAQINRTSWQKANKNEGRYDITCLADANELERGSARVFTTYTSEDLKARKSAQVQILKNRAGETMYEPATVYADGEAYVFMSEEGMNDSFGADGVASMESAFSDLGDMDLDF